MADFPPFARMDRALCLAPGLFRSLERGGRAKPLLINYPYGATSMRFRAPTLLGCDDLRVLVGVAALATAATRPRDRGALDSTRSGEGSVAGRGSGPGDPVCVSCSVARLAAAAGYARGGGALRRSVRESLARLAALEVEVAVGDAWSSSRLLSFEDDGASQERWIRVTLGDRPSRCASGALQYARVDLVEARGLSSDVARRLHVRWSAHVDAGASRRIGLDRLGGYVWGEDKLEEATPAATRRRRTTLRKAFAELRSVGWTVDASKDPGCVWISRPRPVGTRSRNGSDASGVTSGTSDAPEDDPA